MTASFDYVRQVRRTGHARCITRKGNDEFCVTTGKLLTPQTSGANVGHGRILTATDYQLVSLYTDLKRSDIENLQSIAGIYDVAQMRGLLKCRLDQMEKRRRYLSECR